MIRKVDIGIGFLMGMVICIFIILVKNEVEPKPAPEPQRQDTILRGMHYAVWTEPRTGDVYVVNVTLDSLKARMFNSQIK